MTHGIRDAAQVALTFHGAGDPSLADRLLSIAERASIGVTVFAVGSWLVERPEMGPRILRGGHLLGNHTMHHLPMRTMDEATAFREIEDGLAQVRRHVATPTWFRPSGTPSAGTRIRAAAGRAGYTSTVSYDVDPRDYEDPGAVVVGARVLADIQKGSIVSLHLGHEGTVRALPAIIAGLQARRLRAVTLSQLLPAVHP